MGQITSSCIQHHENGHASQACNNLVTVNTHEHHEHHVGLILADVYKIHDNIHMLKVQYCFSQCSGGHTSTNLCTARPIPADGTV